MMMTTTGMQYPNSKGEENDNFNNIICENYHYLSGFFYDINFI